MKNSIKAIIATITITGFFSACTSYDFGVEQYKNEINLLSNSSLMYDRQVASMKTAGDTIFIVAGVSGTLAPTQPFNVALVEYDSLFNLYNKSNFDIEVSRFAKKLPKNCYTIPQLQRQIPTGEFQTKFPIHLRNLDKLSPDTVYLLDYKIDPIKSSAYNRAKAEVLLRVYMENEFATTKTNTFYNYTSSYVTVDGGTPMRPTNANQMFPLGQDSVRMLAGNETFGDYKTALSKINNMSIRVVVGNKTSQNPEARYVKIEPYRTIDVVQMPPFEIYDNTYLINIISTPDGRKTYYKEFRLHYKYRLTPSASYKEVKAILRMEYNPRATQL